MKNKLLLVAFPVDLGSRTFAEALIRILKNRVDLEVYRFAPRANLSQSFDRLHYLSHVLRRCSQAIKLCCKVRAAEKEGRTVLFQFISPAVFAYPAAHKQRTFIITDWTRKLYESIRGASMSPWWLTRIHSRVLNAQKCVLGVTDTVLGQIARDYNVPSSRLKKVAFPFDTGLFEASPQRHDREMRILFVGGNFYRKGGDLLLEWHLLRNYPEVKITVVSKSRIEHGPGVTVLQGVQFGTRQHLDLFKAHDLFVLPTRYDAYPMVLGEAAAAGLAIITSENALGAHEVIEDSRNGFICRSKEELFEKLDRLHDDRDLLKSMKIESRLLMKTDFSEEKVFESLRQCLFDD
jgi:glycosyltransferase involved in cell wall biosynthesis